MSGNKNQFQLETNETDANKTFFGLLQIIKKFSNQTFDFCIFFFLARVEQLLQQFFYNYTTLSAKTIQQQYQQTEYSLHS